MCVLVRQRLNTTTNEWRTVLTDCDWDTQFLWRRYGVAESIVTAKWHIYVDNVGGALPATFRVAHFGYYKHLLGTEHPYSGVSSSFVVTPPMKRKK